MKKLLTIVAGVAFIASLSSCKKCIECKIKQTGGTEQKGEYCGNKSEREKAESDFMAACAVIKAFDSGAECSCD